jgi:hypothetical protein
MVTMPDVGPDASAQANETTAADLPLSGQQSPNAKIYRCDHEG